jgi:hypothetical protein
VTLVEFLLARVAEDEEVAQAARKDEQFVYGTDRWYQPVGGNGCPQPTVSMAPHRAVADCAARRAIIELQDSLAARMDDRYWDAVWDVLRLLVEPFKTHPDFSPAWLQD